MRGCWLALLYRPAASSVNYSLVDEEFDCE